MVPPAQPKEMAEMTGTMWTVVMAVVVMGGAWWTTSARAAMMCGKFGGE